MYSTAQISRPSATPSPNTSIMSGDLDDDTIKFLGFFILVLGNIGNGLSLVVLCRKQLRTSKIGPYLIALNVTDIFALNTTGTFEILKLYNIRVDLTSMLPCRLALSVFVFMPQCSSWLTVIITVERMICICKPLSSLRRSVSPLVIVFTMILALLLLDVGFVSLFIMPNGMCNFPLDDQLLYISFSYSYIPSLILVVCNSVIVYKICHRPALGQIPGARPNCGNTVKVVLAINLVFLVTTLPVSLLLNFGKGIQGNQIILADFISCLNNAVNFLLYVLFNKSFRKEFKSLFQVNLKSCVGERRGATEKENVYMTDCVR